MTIEEMKARKAELGYTNEKIAELSGVPLGTVQKIFSGETRSPRYDTVQKLVKLLERAPDINEYKPEKGVMSVGEPAPEQGYGYQAQPVQKKKKSKYADYQIPQKKVFGIANGKIKLPPDEMFFDDEIAEMFEDI